MNRKTFRGPMMAIIVGASLLAPGAADPSKEEPVTGTSPFVVPEEVEQTRAPVISRLTHNAGTTLTTEDSFELKLQGEPGAEARFSILGHLNDWPMQETAPGHYQARLPVGRGLVIPEGTLVATLSKHGHRSLAQAEKKVNISAPATLAVPHQVISEPSFPDPGEQVAESRPRIQFTFSQPIQPQSVRLSIDGLQVTDPLVLGQQVVFEGGHDLPVGVHFVAVEALAESGEKLHDNWTFRVHPLAYSEPAPANWVSVTDLQADSDLIVVSGESRPFSVIKVETRPVEPRLSGLAVFKLPPKIHRTLTDAEGHFYLKIRPRPDLSLKDQKLIITASDEQGREADTIEISL